LQSILIKILTIMSPKIEKDKDYKC